MEFLKKLAVSLTATGPAAIICILIIRVTALGIWGSGLLAERAMTILQIVGGGVIFVLTVRGWN